MGKAHRVATNPEHPYTRKLQMAAPVADPKKQRLRRAERLELTTEELSSPGSRS
ncbi:hypothetical protein [Actinomadura vinacea]